VAFQRLVKILQTLTNIKRKRDFYKKINVYKINVYYNYVVG